MCKKNNRNIEQEKGRMEPIKEKKSKNGNDRCRRVGESYHLKIKQESYRRDEFIVVEGGVLEIERKKILET